MGGEKADLAADISPVAFIKVEHGQQGGVARSLAELLDKIIGKLGQTVEIQVHGEKSHVACHIAIAEALVELDAVVNIDLLGQTDVGGIEVAIAVANLSFLEAFGKEFFLGEKSAGV